MPKKLLILAALLLALGFCPPPGQAASDFRQQNDLIAYSPPAWFLAGHFVAREVGPRYLFGSVGDFVKALGGPTAWLIEQAEAERQERLAKEGKNLEYTVYLEANGPGGPLYWVFVVMPHKSAQEWFDERWAYHKSKAKAYYGQTQSGLEKAFAQGLTVSGELRFLVEGGQPSLKPPEELLLQGAGSPPSSTCKTTRPCSAPVRCGDNHRQPHPYKEIGAWPSRTMTTLAATAAISLRPPPCWAWAPPAPRS